MDRISWKSTFGLALAAMVCLFAAPTSAGITYNVTNDLGNQDGWSLSGTITVSGLGELTQSSAITAWDLTASKTDSESHRISNTTSTATPLLTLTGTVYATPTTLSLAAGELILFENSSSGIQWIMEMDSFPCYNSFWEQESLWFSYDFNPIVDGALILGTASSSAVPEIDPAGIGSVLALVTGALGLLERRRLKMA
jgi:hypothetical protein